MAGWKSFHTTNWVLKWRGLTTIVMKANRTFFFFGEWWPNNPKTDNWAKSLLCRLNFVKRRGSSTENIANTNFVELKLQFLLNIEVVMELEDVLPRLVLNWDRTRISTVPRSSHGQWNRKVCGSLTGNFLSPQLIYQGMTAAGLLHYQFPDDWHVTCTPSHWSSEEKVKGYVYKIVLTYISSNVQRCSYHAINQL